MTIAAGADTRERIKTEAMKLFVAHGVDAVSVRDIADRVGMKPSNLYSHFHSREDLIRELFTEGYGEYGRELSEIAARNAPFGERLEAMIRFVCDKHDNDVVRFRFLLLAQHTTLGQLPKSLRSPVDVVQDSVAAAIAAGEIPPRDPALLTAMIFGVVLQAATFRLYGRLSAPLGSLAGELAGAALMLAMREPSGGAGSRRRRRDQPALRRR